MRTCSESIIIIIILSRIYAMCQVSWRDRFFSFIFVFIFAEDAKTASDHCVSQIMTTVEYTLCISLKYSFTSNNLICSKNQLDRQEIYLDFFSELSLWKDGIFFGNWSWVNYDGFIMFKFLRLSFDYSENKKVYRYTCNDIVSTILSQFIGCKAITW